MPSQYSFSDFDPREFEFLCRDLLQRKITEESGKPFFFNSFSDGADGGMDAIFEDNEEKIVLQCKRYHDFGALYRTLKHSELPKVEKLSPTRYIIATSCQLSQKQVEKIYALFKPYVTSINDIFGRAMINNLLTCYPDIELNYPRLYLANASVLNRLLQANVYNQSLDKLRQFKKISRYYVPDDSFQKALRILGDKRYVIISGEPGVGKSTLAGMLSLYYVEQGYEFIFLRRSIAEAESSVWDEQRKQLFFFDDFLGSTTFEGFDRNEDRQLLEFISKIAGSTNKLLLITTREYVFKQAEAMYPELKRLEFTKHIIRQSGFTPGFKINILYNYLYYSPVELKHIEPFVWSERYDRIIYHRNFTPRLINDYIERHYNRNDPKYSLLLGLKKYLDDPYTYWEQVFLKLNDNAQMLLLIMGITQEPAIKELIFETFVNVGKHRKIYKKGYEKDSFEQAMAELSPSFISILHNPDVNQSNEYMTSMDYSLIFNSFSKCKFLEFQNPSIKDFVIHYLRKREDLITFLIESATLFNQLSFVFTTLEDDKTIDDYENDYSVHMGYSVGKILLSPALSDLLAKKMMKEFDVLPVVKIRRIDWQSDVSSFHLNESLYDNRMDKLRLMCYYFSLNEKEDIRNFVFSTYKQILEEDRIAQQPSSDNKYHSMILEERIAQPGLIKKLHAFAPFDPLETISGYVHNIRFAKEFIYLSHLQEIFPDAYSKIVTSDIKQIRKKIKALIYDDIDYYLGEGTHEADEAIDELIDIDLEWLEQLYTFKVGKKLMRDINEMAGEELFRLDSKKKPDTLSDEEKEEEIESSPESEILDQQRYEGYELALERLMPDWEQGWDDEAAAQYIRSRLKNATIATSFLNRINRNSYYKNFLQSIISAELLMKYLKQYEDDVNTGFLFYERITRIAEIKSTELTNLQEIAYYLYVNDLFAFRKETFELAKPNHHAYPATAIGQYSALLEQQDIWFRFPDKAFHVFLVAKYILSLPQKDKIVLYKSFEKDYEHYADKEILWRFCYEADKDLFCTHFILPVIRRVLDLVPDGTEEEMAVKFLKEYDFSYDFYFSKEDREFLLSSGGGGDALIEDISSTFEEWSIPAIFWEMENCFNISLVKNKALKHYMRDHCPVRDRQYKINISQELASDEFIKLLQPGGIVKIIMHYIQRLKNLIEDVEQHIA